MPISRTHRPLVSNASGNTVDTEASTVANLLGLTVWGDISSTPTTLAGYNISDAAALVHTHAAADITSGVFNQARLGTGGGGSTKFLREDGTWQAVAGGSSALDDLTDVVIVTPATGHILRYDGTDWDNVLGTTFFAAASHTHDAADINSGTINHARLGSGGGGATKFLREDNTWQTVSGGSGTLNDLTDVIITAAATGDILRFNGTDWVDYPDSNFAAASHNHAAADITSGILATARGGTGIAFFTAAGPTVARTYTFPDANATILTTNAAVTTAQGGTGVATFTSNGVLYGNGAGNILVTAQGAANSVLTANAGAPSFSSTPRLDRIGLGQAADASAVMAATGQYFSTRVSGIAPGSVDFNSGNVIQVQLVSGANTVTVSNPKSGGRYVLEVKQPASGAAGTVTWPSTFKWSAGTAPTLTATNGLTDVVVLVYNGTNFIASCALNFNV
jgi:hypothetical protein